MIVFNYIRRKVSFLTFGRFIISSPRFAHLALSLFLSPSSSSSKASSFSTYSLSNPQRIHTHTQRTLEREVKAEARFWKTRFLFDWYYFVSIWINSLYFLPFLGLLDLSLLWFQISYSISFLCACVTISLSDAILSVWFKRMDLSRFLIWFEICGLCFSYVFFVSFCFQFR